jgi:hypothetical protein
MDQRSEVAVKKSIWLGMTLGAVALAGYFVGSREDSVVVRAQTASKWVKTEIPLQVFTYSNKQWAGADAAGFWQSTSSLKDRQLISPIAVKIHCDRGEKMCREVDAAVQFGILTPALLEYEISSWTESGIVADDTDEGECAIGHRLSIDFKGNSVTLTDYPKKANNSAKCKAFQEANSYALHAGQLMLYPIASWDAGR